MHSPGRLHKLLARIGDLIDILTKERNAFLQCGIDPYMYIQKGEEFVEMIN